MIALKVVISIYVNVLKIFREWPKSEITSTMISKLYKCHFIILIDFIKYQLILIQLSKADALYAMARVLTCIRTLASLIDVLDGNLLPALNKGHGGNNFCCKCSINNFTWIFNLKMFDKSIIFQSIRMIFSRNKTEYLSVLWCPEL